MKNLGRALRYFRADGHRLVVVAFLLLVSVGASLLKPWPLAVMVDSVFGGKPLPIWLRSVATSADPSMLVGLLALSVLLLHLAQSGFCAAQNYVSIQIGLSGLRRVRDEVFNCLQRLSLRFIQGARSGDLIHRAAWDTYSFQTLFQQGFVVSISAMVSLILMLIVMWRLNVVLTLVALMAVPLLVLLIKYFGRRMTERGTAAQQADSMVTSFVQQSIAALPLVQSYTREEHESSSFSSRTAAAMEKRLAQHGSELRYWLAISVVFALGTAGMMWLGSKQVLAGRLSVGELLIFLAYLAQIYEPLNQLSQVGATVANATAGIQRVFEILDTPEEVKDAPNARPAVRALARQSTSAAPTTTATPHVPGIPVTAASRPRLSRSAPDARALQVTGGLAFDDVSFSYQREQSILRGVTFQLNPGDSAALIGPSGVGKTTLLNLILRFFDPTSGVIRLDGVDLRELRLKDLRMQIALVLQEPILLPASIAENIAYGKPRARRTEIEAAAKAANADEFIRKLPNGYVTIVGEGGTRLSVGERQRLNLARAFLKDAPILLLDEPTSALDAESEALVTASLGELMKGRTTLIVAHRLSTIRQVNRILVLGEGRLIEEGTPEELLKQDGYYAKVTKGQLVMD